MFQVRDTFVLDSFNKVIMLKLGLSFFTSYKLLSLPGSGGCIFKTSLCWEDVISSQAKRLKLRDVEILAQGYRAGKWPSRAWIQVHYPFIVLCV